MSRVGRPRIAMRRRIIETPIFRLDSAGFVADHSFASRANDRLMSERSARRPAARRITNRRHQ
ncbi:hypothetical protein F9948_30710 [Burkholderia thailandensis]|nr:hypothetical protein [Burkholderia thailandensis]MDD1490545.1 hypothetical protein [Burkholderia thailandensis]MDD1496611.1 hypothetical protein [Burkholderia thailandensis]TGB31023.1 hypothetical protein C6946_25330 [Burkholderia thailandensis]